MGSTMASSTSCVPRSLRAKRRRRRVNVKRAFISAFTSFEEHGNIHRRADGPTQGVIAAAADHGRVADILCLNVATVAVVRLGSQEEKTEAIKLHRIATLVVLV